ncbi:tetratricopeptide repeat protein [Aliikangiella maris]|uniref:Tetratricopeptide repeat protein n=2 Tax=Aliikangiella maris TaxID=3162458 RepID=A0ABV3MPL7_9GAMM
MFNFHVYIRLIIVACIFMCNFLFAHGVKHDRVHQLSHQISKSPNNPQLYIKRGRVYQDSEEYVLAMQDYQQALKLDNNFHEALYWQGYIYSVQGQLELAEKQLLNYLKQQPDSPAGHRTLAKVYEQKNQLNLSIRHFDQAIDVDKKTPPQVYLERTRVQLKIKPLPIVQIEQGLNQAIKNFGAIVTIIELMVESYQHAQQWHKISDAIALLPKSLQQSPQWLYKKAFAYQMMNHNRQAKQTFIQVQQQIERLPEHRKNNPAFQQLWRQTNSQLKQLHE